MTDRALAIRGTAPTPLITLSIPDMVTLGQSLVKTGFLPNSVKTPEQAMAIVERFFAKVDRSGECWEWIAAKDPRGYGRFGAVNPQVMLAHRFSYGLHFGFLLPGLVVAHECDNPSCVNPLHLFHTSQAGNLQDMANKDRSSFGERRYNAKLNTAKVQRIRDLQSMALPQSLIGKMVGVDQSIVSEVLSGKRWARA